MKARDIEKDRTYTNGKRNRLVKSVVDTADGCSYWDSVPPTWVYFVELQDGSRAPKLRCTLREFATWAKCGVDDEQ